MSQLVTSCITHARISRKCPLVRWEIKKMGVLQTSYFMFRFLCKGDYESDNFIHAPMYIYNEVMRLLELAGIVECE